jgi:hypothetical protein
VTATLDLAEPAGRGQAGVFSMPANLTPQTALRRPKREQISLPRSFPVDLRVPWSAQRLGPSGLQPAGRGLESLSAHSLQKTQRCPWSMATYRVPSLR